MKSEEVRGKRKMQIYVDGNAVRSGNGQKEYPFQTISEAAKIARVEGKTFTGWGFASNDGDVAVDPDAEV